MAKTELTKKLEELLFQRLGRAEIGCGEVMIGWFGHEIVDFITCTVDKNRYIKCFEIKVSKSDFHSDAKLTFIGHYNYFVMPEELYEEVKTEIPYWIGVYAEKTENLLSGKGELKCIKKSRFSELKADKEIIFTSMLRSMQREWFKCLEQNKEKKNKYSETLNELMEKATPMKPDEGTVNAEFICDHLF